MLSLISDFISSYITPFEPARLVGKAHQLVYFSHHQRIRNLPDTWGLMIGVLSSHAHPKWGDTTPSVIRLTMSSSLSVLELFVCGKVLWIAGFLNLSDLVLSWFSPQILPQKHHVKLWIFTSVRSLLTQIVWWSLRLCIEVISHVRCLVKPLHTDPPSPFWSKFVYSIFDEVFQNPSFDVFVWQILLNIAFSDDHRHDYCMGFAWRRCSWS